ncbi:MAG TPA: MFS transporter [Pseudoneobacillus sp.]|nr:MFS transporter [Pseudoneobacillus sp.]
MLYSQLLKNKPFIFLFWAALMGVLGEGIFGLTTIVLVLKETNSIMEIGKMLVLTLLPSVLLAPFVGVLIDRSNKYKMAIYANFARFVTLLFIPISAYFGLFHMFIFFITILLSYIIWFILEPVKESILKEVLPQELFRQGISFIQGAWQVGLLASALIAGMLIDLLGSFMTIFIASFTYVIAGFLFLLIKNSNNSVTNHPKSKGYLSEFQAGWQYLWSNKKALSFVLITSSVLPFFYAINALIAPFNYKILDGTGLSLGWIDSGAGIGSLLSAVLCTFISNKRTQTTILLSSILLLSITTFLFSLSINLFMAFMMYVFIGIFIGNIKVLSRIFVFENINQKYVGRVMTTVSLFSLSFSIAVSLGVSFIAERSIKLSYLIVAIGLALPLLFFIMGMKKDRNSIRMEKISHNKGT